MNLNLSSPSSHTVIRLLICLLIALTWSTVLFSQTQKHHEAHTHNNHAGIFVGSTAQYDNGRHLFTLGLDYTRYIDHGQKWGIGSFLEVIFGDHAQWLGGIPVIYKPIDNLILRTGPGIELVKNSNNSISGKLVLRAGIAYDIQFEHITITPSFDVDYVRQHPSMVWGVAIGKSF